MEAARLTSVNVSSIRELPHRGTMVPTGIFKRPVFGRVAVARLGLEGDRQADLDNHGGVYQAVYAYPVEHYAYWQRELNGTTLEPGQFGENLTLEGLLEDAVHVGDVFRIGTAVLQVTQARTPCYKLGAKMARPSFPKTFLASRRLGFYCRVLEEGALEAGDALTFIKTDPVGLTVAELIELMYFDRENRALLDRALAVPALSPGWRTTLAERIPATR